MSDLPTIADKMDSLRAAFPNSQVGKLPKGGVTLDYVGHGAVTSRLLDVDPFWSWEPVAHDEHGLPLFTVDNNGNPIAFWIRLTVCGVTRLGCGTCRPNQFDAEKVLIGDAIRNAAMRFGVALDLWIKGHGEDDEKHANDDQRSGPARSFEDPALPGLRSSLLGSIAKLPDSEKAALKAWMAEQQLPAVARMNATQCDRVVAWLMEPGEQS